MSDKYLPDITQATSINYVDLFYLTGSSAGDYKVYFQDLRKSLNPAYSTVTKSSDYSLSDSDCTGKWFSNKPASSTISFILPQASSGLIVGFIIEAFKYLLITPQAGDKIASIGIDGQSIRSNTLRDSIVLRATDDDWYVVSKNGTWSAV